MMEKTIGGGKQGLGAELDEAVAAFERKDCADCGAGHCDHGKRFRADFVELAEEFEAFKGASGGGAEHLPDEHAEFAKPFEEAVDGIPDCGCGGANCDGWLREIVGAVAARDVGVGVHYFGSGVRGDGLVAGHVHV